MRATLSGVLAGCLLMLSGAPLQAQPAAPFDQLFLRNEALGSAYELAIAQLAQARATSDAIRRYAATLVNDHEAYNAALRTLAQQKGVALPPGLSARSAAKRDDLARLHNTAFDRAFIREARRVNDDDMRNFRQEASRTADPDIRAFVAKFLPIDEQHARDAAAISGTAVATMQGSRTPVIKPPATNSAMPVIPPPADSAMPVINPPTTAK